MTWLGTFQFKNIEVQIYLLFLLSSIESFSDNVGSFELSIDCLYD